MNKEISYLKASPGDAKPVNKDIVQNSTDSELSRDKTAVQWFEKNAGKQYGS